MPLTGVPGAGGLVPPVVVGASPPERLAEVPALSARGRARSASVGTPLRVSPVSYTHQMCIRDRLQAIRLGGRIGAGLFGERVGPVVGRGRAGAGLVLVSHGRGPR